MAGPRKRVKVTEQPDLFVQPTTRIVSCPELPAALAELKAKNHWVNRMTVLAHNKGYEISWHEGVYDRLFSE